MNKKLWLLGAALAVGTTYAAVPNNTLLMMVTGDVSTLDPAQAYDTAASEPIENMYESLIGYKGKSITEYTPLLATSYKISADGKSFTFDLRKNVKFHSGNVFSCADAEYTFERLLVTHNSDAPGWFISISMLGFDFWDDATKKTVTFAQIDNAAECNSAGQLVLKLVKRDPAFLSKLLYTATSIVDKKHAISVGEWSGTEKDWKAWVDKDLNDSELSKKPSGTGAYQFVSRTPNQGVYKRFADYWGGTAKIENVIVQTVNELATKVLALNKGDADLITLGNNRSNLKQVQGQPGVKVLDDVPGAAAPVVFLNQNIQDDKELGSGKLDGKGIPANFFSDVNVRKAFNYSFDGKKLIDQVFLGKGEIRTMALPSNYLGYDPKIPVYSFNAERATAAFKKAFGGQVWQNGFTINLTYNTGSTPRQTIAEILKANIEALNPKFKVNINAIAFSTLLKLADTSKLAVSIGSWLADYPDTDNFLRTFYASDGYFKGRLNFKDATIDTLIDQAYATNEASSRATIYKQVGRRAYELAPVILVPSSTNFLTYRDNVKGVEENYNGQISGNFGTFWKNLSK